MFSFKEIQTLIKFHFISNSYTENQAYYTQTFDKYLFFASGRKTVKRALFTIDLRVKKTVYFLVFRQDKTCFTYYG